MKSQVRVLVIALGLFCTASGFAQTAAPAAKASAPAVTAPAVAAPAAAPAAPTAKAATTAPAKTSTPLVAAAGGGDGKVWVNAKSKTYHCEGSKFYGKTKAGEYMAEADAKGKGYHGVNGKACGK
jgi:hypothetical protein